MFKTFSFGIVFGLVATGGLLYLVPVVDQERERSIITVRANGGVNESFHVNLPLDRVLAGRDDLNTPVPVGLNWPDDDLLQGTQTEIFKVRNAEDKVVGVASRMVGGAGQPFVEWAVHLPARGTLYLVMPNSANEAGVRVGTLQAGTQEFATLSGGVVERYVAAENASGDDAGGRLELVTSLVDAPGPARSDDGGDP